MFNSGMRILFRVIHKYKIITFFFYFQLAIISIFHQGLCCKYQKPKSIIQRILVQLMWKYSYTTWIFIIF